MPSIDTTLKLVDRISKPLQRIANSTNLLVERMERLQRLANSGLNLKNLDSVAQQTTNTIKGAVGEFQRLSTQAVASKIAIDKLSKSTTGFSGVIQKQQKIGTQQKKITEEVNKTNSASTNWGSTIAGVLGTYVGLQTVGAGISIADEATQTTARLNNVNDQLQTTAELQNLIYESAQRSGGSFLALQQSVAKLGATASDAFGNTKEIVAFSELVQKSFSVGGASNVEQEAGLYQLTQALASGRLQGDEFRSIIENAPLIAKSIAEYVGVGQAELKALSSEGVITSDIIKGAIFASADDIEKKFAEIPLTFGGAFTQIKNFALQTLTPVINYLNQALNSEIGIQAINNIKIAIQQAGPILMGIIDATLQLGAVFNAVFPYIPAIVTTAVTALLAYYAITKQQLIIDTYQAIQKGILTAVTFAQTVAVSGLTVAWHALNTAMKANVIILVISAIVALVAWVINLAKTNDDFAIGFLKAWHGILNFFDRIPAYFYTLIDAMIEPFKLWAKTIGKLYDAVINGIIDGINTVLKLVNKVTGSSYELSASFSFEKIVDKLDEFVGVKKDQAFAKADGKAYLRQLELAQFKADRANRATNNAPDTNSAAYGGVGDFSSFGAGAGAGGNIGNIGKVGEVGKIKDTVDISSEDLKTMRELAEMNSIQNFVTLQPSVSFGDTNIRQDGQSIETIISKISTVIDEQFNASARKVFA